MRILSWALKAIVFFTLFAFALNNQDPVVVHWFFGIDWTAPLVIVVLLAFAGGCAVGVLAMLPGWWRARRRTAEPVAAPPRAAVLPSGFDTGLPPREGL